MWHVLLKEVGDIATVTIIEEDPRFTIKENVKVDWIYLLRKSVSALTPCLIWFPEKPP